MNLGIGTLAELKVHLLNEALRDQETYDAAIASLGKGVCARFEEYCNRKFARMVGDTHEFEADRCHVVVPRYPLESVSAVHLRTTLAAGWVDQGTPSGLIENLTEKAGIVEFSAPLGSRRERGRLTFTGGFWFDDSADGSVDSRKTQQQGSADLSAGNRTKAIEFDAEFDEAPIVIVTVVPPEGGTIISAVPQAVTTEGFTARLAFPIPGAGYKLHWIASSSSSSSGSQGSQPAGSTARPADLFLAWLLQCEYVWKLRDKLGINLAGGGADAGAQLVSLSLAGVKLAPDVEETLRKYQRYALS